MKGYRKDPDDRYRSSIQGAMHKPANPSAMAAGASAFHCHRRESSENSSAPTTIRNTAGYRLLRREHAPAATSPVTSSRCQYPPSASAFSVSVRKSVSSSTTPVVWLMVLMRGTGNRRNKNDMPIHP